MLQVAVFVDAGYLYAQGSTLLAGQRRPRSETFARVPEVIEDIRNFAERVTGASRTLRVYWYDGVLQGRLSADQEQLATCPLCKLRLGLVNSRGEQKGVDSLIVTDMIELARNRAITDAVLVAGDEDIRIGVQIAQSFGVQVHLVGIRPAKGSQSLELVREADVHHEWDREQIERFLVVEQAQVDVDLPQERLVVSTSEPNSMVSLFERIIQAALDSMQEMRRQAVIDAFVANSSSVPTDLDRIVLPRAGQELGRMLEDSEKRELRAVCKAHLIRLYGLDAT